MNRDLPWPFHVWHELHHSGIDAECAGQHRRGKDQNGNDEPDHARAATELRKFTAPQHRTARDRDTNQTDGVCDGAGQ